jgi:hypothetical protein
MQLAWYLEGPGDEQDERRETARHLRTFGGRWDRRAKVFVGEASEEVRVYFHAGQHDAASWFADWLSGYVEGVHEPHCQDIWSLGLVGGRRSGKSHLGVHGCGAFGVAVPGARVWLVSPAQEETEELHDEVEENLWPAHWYRWSESRSRFVLANGSRVWLRSARENLKRGRGDLVLLNEAQEMPRTAFVKVRPATADRGGLTMLAANPPDKAIGQWVLDFYDETKAATRDAKLFEFDPRANPYVEHASLEAIKQEVDLDTYEREILGVFKPIGDRVFHAWNSRLNILDTLDGFILPDITAAITKRHFGAPFEYVGFADFQLVPFEAGAICKLYGTPEDLHLVWIAEAMVEKGDEDQLIDALEDLDTVPVTPSTTVFVGDASGDWQNTKRDKGAASFDRFRARRYRIFKPDPGSDRNPELMDTVKAANAVICNAAGRRRMFSLARNEHLNRALNRWENRNGAPNKRSDYSHFGDLVRYAAARFFPRRVVSSAKVEMKVVEQKRSARYHDLRRVF